MITTVFNRLRRKSRPTVSFVLLDWSCRESFHSLDYLARQDAPRDDYEIIWIEYYQHRSPQLDQMLADYAEKNLPAPVDQWLIMGMPPDLYYHKHLMYNIGIARAHGEYVIICDSDAMFTPDFVSTVIATFKADPNIALHFDEVRNHRRDLYPFNYPPFEELIGEGVINWRDGKTTGLWDTVDPLHTLNYGACFCARRDDLIAIGGADEHLDYLGHVCGPNEMTWRLVNKGRKEVWHESVFLYHTWHPGSDGEFNYIGPSDGRNMSTTALEARASGRVMPLVENAVIRAEREGRSVSEERLIDPAYLPIWTKEAVAKSPRFTLFKHKPSTKLVLELPQHNVLEYDSKFYGVPHSLGAVDLQKEEDRGRAGILCAETLAEVQELLAGGALAGPPAPRGTAGVKEEAVEGLTRTLQGIRTAFRAHSDALRRAETTALALRAKSRALVAEIGTRRKFSAQSRG